MREKSAVSGFTLIELAIVVLVLTLLATIAVPRFGQTLTRSQEGGLKGNLGAIRSALKIYYGDLEGQFPSDITTLTQSAKYLRRIPTIRVPGYHEPSNAIVNATVADDAGGWVYDNTPTDSNYGSVWVNCTHTDTKNTVWTRY